MFQDILETFYPELWHLMMEQDKLQACLVVVVLEGK